MARQYCPGGQWTNVVYLAPSFPFSYSLTCPVRADWRKYGIGSFPPYEQGSFIGTIYFWHHPFESVFVEIKPDSATYIDFISPFG